MEPKNMEENYNLAKWLSGEKEANEISELQNKADLDVYNKIKQFSSNLEAPNFKEEKLYSTIIKTPKKGKKIISLYQNWMFKVAAMLLLSISLYVSYNKLSITTEYAEKGKKSSFRLPDYSEVVLNSDSKLDYNKWNWNDNRILNLNGEAYFKVAKGKKFEVKTPNGKVTVLGTQFNVKQRNNRFEVTCYEGKVKVNYKNQETFITKGLSVAFDGEDKVIIPIKTIQKPEWLSNEMIFYQEDITSIIQELERHFNVSIEIKDFKNSQLFTGNIPIESLDNALEVLTITYHLNSTKINSTLYILKPINAEK
jgi:transmembrane sensor